MSGINPDLIVPEGDRETQVFQKLLNLPSSDTPREKGGKIAGFIKPQNDAALPYNAFQVALRIAMALPSDHQDTYVPFEMVMALNREDLVSTVRRPLDADHP